MLDKPNTPAAEKADYPGQTRSNSPSDDVQTPLSPADDNVPDLDLDGPSAGPPQYQTSREPTHQGRTRSDTNSQ